MKKFLTIFFALMFAFPFAISAAGCKKVKETSAKEFEFEESKNGYYQITKFVGKSKNIIIPSYYKGKDVVRINDSAFAGTSIESVVISSKVWIVDSYAFEGCEYLKSVTVKSGKLQEIRAGAFLSCQALKTVNLSGCANLTVIESSAFCDCYNLTTINLSGCKNLTTIEASTFYQCKNLTTVDLSGCKNLAKIGTGAFSKSGLKEIILPTGFAVKSGMFSSNVTVRFA